jgi:galactokinase
MFPLDKLKPYITQETILAYSPARINMIGEHTDYNNGFVLPTAIDKSAYVLLTPEKDEVINLYAVDLDKKYSTRIIFIYKTGEWPMGGGFDGCMINLIKEDKVDDLIKELSEAYEKEMKQELTAYKVSTSNGISLMTNVQNSYPSHL